MKLVFVLPDELIGADSSNFSAHQLIHPRNGCQNLFVFNATKTKIFELSKISEPNRTWLHGNEIISKGELHMVTAFDPLFLVIPHLVKAAKAFSPASHVVKDECEATPWVVDCVSSEAWEKICDVKHSGGLQVVRYNEDKTLAWLGFKVRRLAKGLEAKNMLSGRSSNYVMASRDPKMDSEKFIAEAVGIVSDYLQPSLAEKLRDHFGISSPIVVETENVEPDAKKQKTGSEGPLEDYSLGVSVFDKNKKETKQSAAQKKLAEAAKGTKNIAAFFKKAK